jgi:hypothetical protein
MCKRVNKKKKSFESFQERVGSKDDAVKCRNIQNNDTHKRAEEMQNKN